MITLIKWFDQQNAVETSSATIRSIRMVLSNVQNACKANCSEVLQSHLKCLLKGASAALIRFGPKVWLIIRFADNSKVLIQA